MTKIFISGSISIRSVDGPILNRLDNMIQKGHTVLIGDADGVDKAIQAELDRRAYRNVIIYCSGETCRNNAGKWATEHVAVPPKVRGRRFYMLKDEKMAHDADYGFLIWDGTSAGTLNNCANLVDSGKMGIVYLVPAHNFFTIKDKSTFDELLGKCNADAIDKIDKKIGFRNKLWKQDIPQQQKMGLEISPEYAPLENEKVLAHYAASVNENQTFKTGNLQGGFHGNSEKSRPQTGRSP